MKEIIGKINGPLFRNQRKLLLKIADLAQKKQPYIAAADDDNLLEGLVNLTDDIADQAHDEHGIDCLICEDEDCE